MKKRTCRKRLIQYLLPAIEICQGTVDEHRNRGTKVTVQSISVNISSCNYHYWSKNGLISIRSTFCGFSGTPLQTAWDQSITLLKTKKKQKTKGIYQSLVKYYEEEMLNR